MKLYKQVKRRGMYKREHDFRDMGQRCEVFARGCVSCDAHMYKLFHGRMPVFWETLDAWRSSVVYNSLPEEGEYVWKEVEGLIS